MVETSKTRRIIIEKFNKLLGNTLINEKSNILTTDPFEDPQKCVESWKKTGILLIS